MRKKLRKKVCSRRAMTLVELVIAMVMITIIFAAVLPQFVLVRNSWDIRQGTAEVVQNARVLMDHFSRTMSKAKQIAEVTASSIDFNDSNDVKWQYEIGTDNYVQFGQPGNLSPLAGPVSSLAFTCYDACDNPVTDVDVIRTVKMQASFTNSGSSDQDKTFTTWAYLRTNWDSGSVLGCWRLDETSGINASDSSGNGNDGTLTNMTGDVEDGLAFDGIEDYVDLGTDSSLNFGSSEPFTVAAWVKVETTENYGPIVSFRSSTDGGPVIDLAVGFDGAATDAGKAMILVRQDGGGTFANKSSGGVVNDGQWHHVAAVRDTEGTVELFVDGVSQGTASGAQAGGAITTNLRAIGSERRWVSDGYGTSDQRYLNGTIEDVRIYGRALSDEEIAEMTNVLRYKGFTEAEVSTDTTSITIPTPGSAGTVSILGSWTSGLTHTAESGSNRLLILTAHVKDNDYDMSLNSVTYGGRSMTKVIERETQESYDRAYVVTYVLGEAGISEATSNVFSPSWSSTPDSVEYSSVFLANVDQNDPVGASAGNGSNFSSTITTSALSTNEGDMVIVVGTAGNTGNYSVNNGFTKSIELSITSADGVAGYKAADGSSETPSITHNEPQRQVIIGFVVNCSGDVIDIEDDLLIAAVAVDGSAGSSSLTTAASGWALIDRGDNGAAVTLGVWWKIAGASESAPTFTWTGGNEQAYGWIMRFTGHNPANPIHASYMDGQKSINPASPAVLATVDDCLILRLGAFDDGDINTLPEPGNPGLPGHSPITMDGSGGGLSILGSWVEGTTHAKEAGSSRALVFIAHAERGGSVALNSVTYGGRPMTKVVERNVSSSGTYAYVVAYILDEAGVAAATSGTFNPSWSSTSGAYFGYASVFLQNVNQTTLIGATASNTSTSGGTITTSALANSDGDMVIDAATCGNSGSYTLDNGFNEGTDQTMGSTPTATGVTGYKAATGVSEIPSATFSSTMNRQVIIGFVVQGAGGVSGGAGYVRQALAGSSGQSDFSLTASNEAQMMTIAIAPENYTCCQGQIIP